MGRLLRDRAEGLKRKHGSECYQDRADFHCITYWFGHCGSPIQIAPGGLKISFFNECPPGSPPELLTKNHRE
jgi:hypothetical protein